MNLRLRRSVRWSVALLDMCLFALPAPLFAQAKPPVKPPSSAAKTTQGELERISAAGQSAFDKSDWPAAIKIYQTGLDKAQGWKNDEYAAQFLGNMGIAYNNLGEYDRALDCHRKALTLKKKIGNPQSIARTIENLAYVYFALDQNMKALKYWQNALAIREKGGKPQDIARDLNSMGSACDNLGQYEKALDYDKRALAIYKKIGSTSDISRCYNGIGNVYTDLGQYDKALEYNRKAYALIAKTGASQPIAESLMDIGVVYGSLGQYDLALDYFQRALALREKGGSQQDIALCLINIGGVYEAIGQYDKSIYHVQQAAAIFEKTGDSRYIAFCLSNIGVAYYDLGQNEQALDFTQRALTLKEKFSDPKGIAFSITTLGNIYYTLRRYDEALAAHQKATPIYTKIGNQDGIAKNLNNIGNVYFGCGRNAVALDYYQRSLSIKERIGNPQDIAYTLDNIGTVYAMQQQWDKAEDAYSRARRLFENFSQQIGDPTQLADLQETMNHFYERYADVLAQQNRAGEGLALLEAGRAQGLARQIALNGSDYTAYFTADEKQELKQRTAEFTIASNLLHATEGQLTVASADQRGFFLKQKSAYQKRQRDAEQKYTAYRDTLFARYPQFREVSGERPPTVAELKSLARKNPDTLFLTFAILEDKATRLFALTDKDGLKTYSLPVGEKELGKLVADWRRALLESVRDQPSDAPANPKEQTQAKALYQTLFAPLEKDGLLAPGRYARLVTVADGPLLDLPFAALENGSGKRLLETHTVASAIALGIAFWRDNPLSPTSDLLCVADPIGSAADKPTRVALRREGFGPLPAAREEGAQIAALFGRQSLLVGPAAKKAEVIRQMAGVKILHFATHGYLNDKNPLLSGLVLAPEPEGSGDDGVLSAREILNRPLAARLAVLSACETGRGVAKGGEGLQGLAWAFRAAGCPCVVASQWQVDDAATKQLMLAFYKGLQAGQRKDDALRDAMLLVKQSKPAPFFWAAFQIIGDTAP